VSERLRVAFALIFSTLLLSGCMQTSQNYATSKSTGTYFTAPSSWSRISQKEIATIESASSSSTVKEKLSLTRWAEAYSSSSSVSAADVLSANAPKSPIAFAQVRYLSGTEINEASYNFLRDLVFPITGWAEGSISAPTDLSILDDSEVKEKGASGIHTQITFTGSDGQLQTFDQTSLLANDRRSIYVFLVRCTTTCFEKNQKVLQKIIDSFTVRGDA